MALEDYYVSRMASIYRTKPKASANVALFAKQMLADGLALEISPSLDIDQAVGVQLDVIGKYVGAPRDVQVADTRPYFGFVTYDYPSGVQNDNGFVLYASLAVNSQGAWFEYEFTGQSTSQLPDYSYRQLLKLKILTNFSNNTMSEVQEQITGFFPNQLQLRDNLDMSLTYFYGGSFQLPLSVLEASLPRPMGVKVTAEEAIAFDISADGLPVFNSETPPPRSVDFGTIQFSASMAFVLTNAKTSSFNVIALTSDSNVFTFESVSPSLPATLGGGDSLAFTLKASSSNPVVGLTATISIFTTSSAGLSSFTFTATVSISGVFLDWMAFDNFTGYSDGSIFSLSDSWGWADNGTFQVGFVIAPADSFSEYTDGSVSTLDGGTDWAADAVFTTY